MYPLEYLYSHKTSIYTERERKRERHRVLDGEKDSNTNKIRREIFPFHIKNNNKRLEIKIKSGHITSSFVTVSNLMSALRTS
jgi:hypothetical protein